MFIFIFDAPISLALFESIYIPLCLYLYAAIFDRKDVEISFTFHYVYIYIRP